MLCLHRKELESITCKLPNGEEIKFVILDVRGTRTVRVGVHAPENVSIKRTDNASDVSPERERMIESGAVKPSAVHLREAGA